MTEEEAKAWLAAHGWWEGLFGDRLRRFVDLVLDEADRQNLISAGSRDSIWARHIVDSAQLAAHPLVAALGSPDSHWIDLGTGAGFPGLVVGCLRERPISLVEVRPLRVAFLKRCAEALNLDHVEVVQSRVEALSVNEPAAVISARAYAPLDRLLKTSQHLSDSETIWLLPKGQSSQKELEIVRPHWQAVFHVEQSVTDADSAILTIQNLKRHVTAEPRDKSAAYKRSASGDGRRSKSRKAKGKA